MNKTTEPAAPEPLGDSEGAATQVVAGLEPVHWYLENEDEYMSEKLRKEHERLNSYTFKLCKVAHPLYSAADVAKLQAENEALKAQLAASQAREQQFREALKALQQGFPQTHQINAVIRHALVTPQDDTALRQWGAKLLRDLADKGWPAWDADDLRLKADELEAGK